MSETLNTDPNSVYDFDKLWDYDNPSETEKKFKELIPVLKDSRKLINYLMKLNL